MFLHCPLRSRGVHHGVSPRCTARRPHPSRQVFLRARGGQGRSRVPGLAPDHRSYPRRPSRMAEQIKRDVSEIVREMDWTLTPREAGAAAPPPMVTVTEVRVSLDFRNATVEVSVFGDNVEAEEYVKMLRTRSGQIRHELARRMRHQRVVPQLQFRESRMGSALRTLQVLDALKRKREARSQDGEEEQEQEQESDEWETDADGELDADELFIRNDQADDQKKRRENEYT
ncbi:hypothetical protein CDCA_CDCA02G0789 [Cyanidium caldarium]|uniref:Ribosome-binding factor A n=1 Tax=Cyanidium caldarium TaxID=2771 RepID=A0AAV9IR21_CYACA|nr:hypothetical protein CDCA_CDCA02G0789 [Cyanidium caldarium]